MSVNWFRDVMGHYAGVLVILFMAIATWGLGWIFESLAPRRAMPEHSIQLQALENTRKHLTELLRYVDTQKNQLEQSKRTLDAIKSEQERLKPLLEIDRKTIDALFAAQEARNQAAQDRERWIGFFLGVASSMIASIIWSFVLYRYRRKGR